MTALPDLRDQADDSAFHGAARLARRVYCRLTGSYPETSFWERQGRFKEGCHHSKLTNRQAQAALPQTRPA
jgi:hypothetical protein